MPLNNLEDLFVHELKDVYHAEKQLTKALPKLAKASTSEDLAAAFEDHLEQTRGHVERIEEIFEMLELPARGVTCAAMEGLIKEGSEMMEEDAPESVMDAGLITAAQRVEHYEIAAYGTLIEFAKLLGHDDAVTLLKQTLAEEEAADKLLSKLAKGGINKAALAEAAAAEG